MPTGWSSYLSSDEPSGSLRRRLRAPAVRPLPEAPAGPPLAHARVAPRVNSHLEAMGLAAPSSIRHPLAARRQAVASSDSPPNRPILARHGLRNLLVRGAHGCS